MRDLGYSIERLSAGQEHFSANLAVLFVIRGEAGIFCQGDSLTMRTGDIFLVNPGVIAEVSAAREALAGVAEFSSGLLKRLLKEKEVILFADSARDRTGNYEDLREILRELTKRYIAGDHLTEAETYSLLLQLLDRLIEGHRMNLEDQQAAGSGSDPRMPEIMRYISSNIGGEINLSELAARMFVSASTLSRTFRKETGMYFADYITRLRVRNSIPALRYSDQNLTQIAISNGFSNSAAFTRAFRKVVGMTPSAYRTAHQEKAREEMDKKREEEENIRNELLQEGYLQASREEVETAVVDAGKEGKLLTPVWSKMVNGGDVYLLTQANIQFHALYLQEHLHIRYVRMWNVFSEKLMITDGSGRESCNFDIVHQALDFLVQHQLKPWIDLARRPDAAIIKYGQEVYFRDEYIRFESRKAWEQCFEEFLWDCIERYGIAEVSTWGFELSHENMHPEEETALYQDPRYSFEEVWRYVCRTLHEKLPEARFGGIGASIFRDREYLKRFLNMCRREGCLPQFFSFVLFPVDMALMHHTTDMYGEKTIDQEAVRQARSLMAECGIGNIPLALTEWNLTIMNRTVVNDSCMRAAYIASRTAKLWDKLDVMSIMSVSDWISSYTDTRGVVNGSIGLLTKDTIGKPAFFAIGLMNKLGGEFVQRGEHYLASRDGRGELYILCFHPYLFLPRAENIKKLPMKEQFEQLNVPGSKMLKLEFQIDGLRSDQDYVVKKRILNDEHGNLLHEWGKFHYDEHLTREEVKYLQAVTQPGIEMERMRTGEDRKLKFSLALEPQEVDLVHIYPRR